jgi:hypothetical protein
MRKSYFIKNKLKRNTTMIERNVRGSVTTGLKMMDNIKKMSRNRYYRTARKYFPNKSNRRFTRGKKRRGGSGKGKGKRTYYGRWDDDDDGGVHNPTSSSKSQFFNVIEEFIHLLTFQTPIIYRQFINNYLYIFFTFLVLFFGTYFSGRS